MVSQATPAWRQAQGAYPGWQIALSFLLGWLFIAIGLWGLSYAPVLIWQTKQLAAHSIHAQAPIVAFQSYPASRNQPHETYRPIVEIKDAGGPPVRCLIGASAYPNPYHIGQKLGVIYPPGKPADALAETDNSWEDAILEAISSSFALLLGIGIVLWMRFFVAHPPEHILWLDRWAFPLKLVSWLTLRKP